MLCIGCDPIAPSGLHRFDVAWRREQDFSRLAAEFFTAVAGESGQGFVDRHDAAGGIGLHNAIWHGVQQRHDLCSAFDNPPLEFLLDELASGYIAHHGGEGHRTSDLNL